MFQSRRFYPFGPTVANSHPPSTKKKEDDVVLLLYVVSISTDVALLGRYAVGDLSASPMLDRIMLRPNGSPVGTAGNGHSLRKLK
jgi:hypothetical protein